jgi:hypothetical protein
MQNKPNQHYVWQKYLEPWLKDDKITCLRNKNVIITTNPRNIASGRFFYTLNGVTSDDCRLIRQLFVDRSPEHMKDVLLGWIEPIQTLLLFENVLEGAQKGTFTKEKKQLLNNILEGLHSSIENGGFLGLCEAQAGNLSFLYDENIMDEKGVNFLLYLSFQYFRTKRMKQSVKKSLGDDVSRFADFDASFNMIALIVSTIFGNSLCNMVKSNEFSFYIIKNSTVVAFITGDQPVVNIHAVLSGEPTEDLALYYPLSPTTALLVTREKDCITECSVEKVKEYNALIEQQSLELVFADDEALLHPYMQND